MDRAEENKFALDYILSQSDLASKAGGEAVVVATNGDDDDEMLI